MTEKIEKINNKTDLINFLNYLAQDFEKNSSQWQNQTVSAYLEAIAAWIEDYSKSPRNNIEWDKIDHKALAQIFYVGKIYE